MTMIESPEHPHSAAPKPTRGLAITALVLGICAFLSGLVPVLGAVLGIAAIIFGIIALKRRQPKGLGLTGLILGALGAIASVSAAILLMGFWNNLVGELESTEFGESTEVVEFDEVGEIDEVQAGDEDGWVVEEVEPPADGGVIPWHALATGDSPISDRAGTAEDPHQLGTRAVSAEWEIVVNSINPDAEDELLAIAPENPPAPDGYRYVLVHVTVNNISGESASPAKLRFYYDLPKQMVKAGLPPLVVPEPSLMDPNRGVTGDFSGYIALRTKDVDGLAFVVQHRSFPERQYFAQD